MSDMSSGLNEKLPAEESKSDQLVEKKPYVSPQLTKLGNVSALTQGGGSVVADGMETLEGGV